MVIAASTSLSQKVVPHLAGGLFQRATLLSLICLHLTLFYRKRDTQTVRQVSHITSISLRISAPQLVVKVSHMQPYAQLLLKLKQDMEQAD